MIKSCSTTKAVFFACRMYLRLEKKGWGQMQGWQQKCVELEKSVKQQVDVRGKSEKEGEEPLYDPGSHQSLLRVQVGRRLVDQVNVSWFPQTQSESNSLQLTTRQVLHLWAEEEQRRMSVCPLPVY